MWWRIGIVCLLLQLLVIDVEAAKDETRLRVSIRKEPLQTVSSCVHAFSQVELLNLDETEPIVIHSVELTEEEIVSAKSLEIVSEPVARQIFISSLSEVTLGPKQNAIIPMTFVPRFPETPSSSSEPTEKTSSSGRRNNRDYQVKAEQFQIKTNIVLETSRGVLKLPIEASSIRQNGYRLPEAIHFRSQGEQPTEIPTIEGGGGGSPSMNDCYDVHMSNPLKEKSLQIFDVVVSRPDLIKMYHHKEEVSDAALTEMFKNWKGDEQRSIAPDVNDEYVITLCSSQARESVPEEKLKRKGGLSRSSDMNEGLGYLQIRTNTNVFVVNLEETEVVDQVDNASNATEPLNVLNMTEKVPLAECESPDGGLDPLAAGDTKDVPGTKTSLSLAVTGTPHIEIELVPYANPSFVKIIELRNSSPYPLKVMQTSVKWDFEGDPVLTDAVRDVGLTVDAKVGKRNPTSVAADPQLLDEAVVLMSKVSPSSSSLVTSKPLRFTGTIHVSATADLGSSDSEWSENIKSDPDKNLAMAFPFAINVLHRQVHIVMDYELSVNVPPTSWKLEVPIDEGVLTLTGLFYPMRRTQGPVTEILKNATVEPIGEEVTYTIAFISQVGRPITDGKLMVDTIDGQKSKTTLCRRFHVSNFITYPTPTRVENSSFFNLGKATVKYVFDKTAEPNKSKKIRLAGEKDGIEIDNGSVLPETCLLQVTEGTGDGRLTIPLIVFSGKLDFTVTDNEMPTRERTKPDRATLVAPSIISGFDEITIWLRSFGMGAALKKILKTMFNNRSSDGPTMLAGYMAGLANRRLLSGTDTIRPILLNAGSVVHGEVQSFPLYLANHNPVPVEVSVDVGEVEGMSISVAREYSHGKGDGNSLLDRIPKEESIKCSRVTSGRWKGHSRRGLKKFLVTSSEFPQAVSSSLQYRDDVSLSASAVDVQPILQTLYREYDVGKFHADSVPRHLHSSDASGCPGLDLGPPEYFEKSARIKGIDPFIMSDRLSVARSLSVCRDKNDTTASQRSRVLIPPGGAARFEFKVRCPSRDLLKSDITNFLGTGLVLSTDYGQIIPVFVSFEALLGNLQLSTPTSTEVNVTAAELSYEETTIDVPPRLFLTHTVTGDAVVNGGEEQSRNSSVPLFVNSTFAREVALNKVESCNPWFDVRLSDHELQNETPTVIAGEKLEIGSMESSIPCRPFHYDYGSDDFRIDFSSQYPRFPSFFECTLEWLQNRFKLQPRGCGLPVDGSTMGKSTEDEVLKLGTEILKKAVHYSHIRFNDGVPRRLRRTLGLNENSDLQDQVATTCDNDRLAASNLSSGTKRSKSPYIERTVVDLFAQLANAWRLITESGLNIVSSNLRAQIGYSLPKEGSESNSTAVGEKMTQTLSVVMRDVAIRTSLDMPSLLDATTIHDVSMTKIGGADVSVLQFPGTRVADVSSVTVPLRNPTSVPVRVRLGAFSTSQNGAIDGLYDDVGFSFVPSDIRDRYLGQYSQVYVQSERVSDQPSRSDADYWWEGGGTFVIPDDRGNLIQARYNTSITAGPGAHISLINPSVHAFNGISMRCGERCGVRDDAQAQSDLHFGKHYSPIGASSAAGSTLMGRPRPQIIPLAPGDRHIGAGGSTPMDSAHLAFAIPYSSLDEIVLPPYGTGELGPILFRPPGRNVKLGCGASVENNITGTDQRSCETEAFESLFFLENSLTGLERVIVRGKGMWERVAVLDPTPSEASPFGDVEHRYGRATLVFPGSAEYHPGIGVEPVRKEVVVHNDGDISVEFGRIHFTQAPELHLNSPIITRSFEWSGRGKEAKVSRVDDASASSCQRRGFRLLGCSEGGGPEIEVNGERMTNLVHGFALDPGQNMSLFVEHYPDCAFNAEYVTLNLEYRETDVNRPSWSPSTSRSRHRAVPNQNRRANKSRNIELLVGFEMAESELPSCISARSIAPWSIGEKHGAQFTASSGTNTTVVKSQNVQTNRKGFAAWFVSPFIQLAVVCSSAVAAFWVMKVSIVRNSACRYFHANFYGINVKGSTNMSPSHAVDSDWPAAFRCLARADPLSSDLQAIGREQARQLVLDRYKSVGAITPHCISSAGVFMRDRSGVPAAGGRAANGSEKKAMTFSDAVFRGALTDRGTESEICELLPCSLGWRAASNKGLVQKMSRNLKSKQLLAERKATMPAVDEVGSVNDSPNQEYTCKNMEDSPLDVSEDMDEHKGDVVSTSESEGTAASVAQEVESPALEEEVDLSGFAKVGSKGASREKNRNKKSSETRTIRVAGKKPTPRKNSVNTLDAPQVLVYKKEPNVTSNSNTPTHVREHAKSSSTQNKNVSDNVTGPQNRVSLQKIKPANARMKPIEIAKPKSRTANKSQAAPFVPPPSLDERTIGIVSSPIGMRSMSSVGSSSPSSPSVSVSSRSTSRSDKNKSAVRPPPGLAPPPGFASGGSGDASDSVQRSGSDEGLPPMVPNLYSSDPSLPFGSGSADLLEPSFSRRVVETRGKSSQSAYVSERPVPSPPAASPVFTSQIPLVRTTTLESHVDDSGFDVMDFLDNILGEQEPLLEEEEERNNIGDLLADKTASVSSVSGIGVSLDPWATERKSRAAAYGINVEPADPEEDIVYAMLAAPVPTNRTNGDNMGSSSLHNSVPLLTPSAMLAANEAAQNSEDGENVSPETQFFSRGSFYSSLLKE